MMDAMTMLGDDLLMEVSGGKRKCKKPKYVKHVEQNQNQSVDIGGDLNVSDGSSVTITFGDQSQTA